MPTHPCCYDCLFWDSRTIFPHDIRKITEDNQNIRMYISQKFAGECVLAKRESFGFFNEGYEFWEVSGN